MILRMIQGHGNNNYVPVFISVHETRGHGVDVCRCADEEDDDQEHGLEIEYGSLFRSFDGSVFT